MKSGFRTLQLWLCCLAFMTIASIVHAGDPSGDVLELRLDVNDGTWSEEREYEALEKIRAKFKFKGMSDGVHASAFLYEFTMKDDDGDVLDDMTPTTFTMTVGQTSKNSSLVNTNEETIELTDTPDWVILELRMLGTSGPDGPDQVVKRDYYWHLKGETPPPDKDWLVVIE